MAGVRWQSSYGRSREQTRGVEAHAGKKAGKATVGFAFEELLKETVSVSALVGRGVT